MHKQGVRLLVHVKKMHKCSIWCFLYGLYISYFLIQSIQALLEFEKAANADLESIGTRDTHRADTKLRKNKEGNLRVCGITKKQKNKEERESREK
jgi:hypothetical protein